MKIEGNKIIFKSTPYNYSKELIKLKNCTVRRICLWSEMLAFEKFYNRFLNYHEEEEFKIEIDDTISRGCFTRTLTDISQFEGLWIFSWRPE